MRNNVLRRLPVERAIGQSYGGGRHRLGITFKTRDLVVLGLGAMIGAGIFSISGVQAATMAGPAVILSFVIAGVVCLLAAMSYAELSSIVPVAGSAYSFTYVAFGEIWGWLVGWAVILELLLAASVVARAWSLFATQTLTDFGVPIPAALAQVVGHGEGFDVFALLILLLLVLMLATGGRIGVRSLWFMVLAKLVVIGLVIGVGLWFFKPGNLTPFIPPAEITAGASEHTVLDTLFGGPTHIFGLWGIFAAAPTIVFAYIGFDIITTTAEETADPPRQVPRGVLISLLLTTVLYIGVAVTMVGMISYRNLDPAKPPLAAAFHAVGVGAMSNVVDIGAVLGLTTVMLALLISVTRVIFSMGRDGLLPSGLAVLSRFQVPSRATLVAGTAAILMSQILNVLTLEQLVVVGTLLAFLFVCASVLALRGSRPDLRRPFRVPAVPMTPVLAILATGWLMLNLKVRTWEYFGIWMAAGLLLYVVYGRRHSTLRAFLASPAPPPSMPIQPVQPSPAVYASPPPPPGQIPGPFYGRQGNFPPLRYLSADDEFRPHPPEPGGRPRQ